MKESVNKEAVRMLVADVGYNEASQRTGIKAGTLRQWARRFNWNVTRSHAQNIVTTVTPPADAHADILQEMETETRLSLARSAQRMAKDAEQATLRDSPFVHKAAQVAGIVHRWESEKGSQTFSLNILNLGSLGVQVRQPDAEAKQVGSE